MFIREQGKKIQFSRSRYDSAKKRCVYDVVFTLDRYFSSESIPADLLPLLNEKERAEAEKYLSDRKAVSDENTKNLYANLAASDLAKITVSVPLMNAQQVADCYAALVKLEKALQAAGGVRPTRPYKKSPAVNQMPLDNV